MFWSFHSRQVPRFSVGNFQPETVEQCFSSSETKRTSTMNILNGCQRHICLDVENAAHCR